MSDPNPSSFGVALTADQSLGRYGSQTITGTSAQTPASGVTAWCAIVVVSPCVFTSLTGTHSGTSGVTYPAGHVIYGRFTALTLASGTVDVYNADPA
jgi:hypothetical protein